MNQHQSQDLSASAGLSSPPARGARSGIRLGAALLATGLILALAWQATWLSPAYGQAASPDAGPTAPLSGDEAERLANEALASGAPAAEEPEAAPPPPAAAQPSVLELFILGGWLMLPIAVMSLVVAVFGIERTLGTRRSKLIPPSLVEALGKASQEDGGLDPRRVYKACQNSPSPAAAVLRAAMLKVGRPHSEVEHTVKEAIEREADKVYANVRPLLLAAVVTPLIGLLGTVWGMVDAFSRTASGMVHANRAEDLAAGIYTALMTTFFGLCVAIPATMLAHWLEGRIQRIFREIDELLLNMLPLMERFEGKLRVQRRPTPPGAAPATGSKGGKGAAGPHPPADELTLALEDPA